MAAMPDAASGSPLRDGDAASAAADGRQRRLVAGAGADPPTSGQTAGRPSRRAAATAAGHGAVAASIAGTSATAITADGGFSSTRPQRPGV